MMKHITLFVALFMACCCYAQEKYSAYPSDFGANFVMKGKTVDVPVTITNTGSKDITSILYILTSDGETDRQQQVKLSTPIKSGKSGQITITFKASSEARKSVKTITISRLNMLANKSEQQTATGSIITLEEKPVVTPLVEEFTGTWCGWCPVGFDGMERAHEEFGNRAVLIAIHRGDVMQAEEFQNLVERVDGFPSAIIDRKEGDFYPAASDLKKQINNEIKDRVTAGTIEVNASWTSKAKTAIKITTKTKFVYADDNANYAIGYALTEDGMKGSGSDWAQNNNLSQNPSYKNIDFWYNAPSRVTGVEFNHVGVAAWGLEEGINGSVSRSFQKDEELFYSYTANISGKKLIQNKNKLNVIALLINRTTGAIVNAAETTAIDDYTTAIEDIEDSVKNTDNTVYDLSGRKVQKPQKGIYIINGKKVAVN
jgi:hypothetical protein